MELRISPNDTFEIQVLNVLPDSFPTVTTVFNATSQSGFPLWNLEKEQVNILEDNLPVNVTDFRLLTKELPLKLGLVVDHSGSMLEDTSLFDAKGFPIYGWEDNGMVKTYEGYISPLQNAKMAIGKFLQNFDWEKDSCQVIGFDSWVDTPTPFTNDTSLLMDTVNNFEESYRTAFYDAVHLAITNISAQNGEKAIVALTDGLDNMSTVTLDSLLSYANVKGTPVFTIGLGHVNDSILKLIADTTNGFYFHLSSASELGEIYEIISKKILSIYAITHFSPNLSSSDTVRRLRFTIDIDSLSFKEQYADYKLNFDQVNQLLIDEEELIKQRAVNYSLYGLSFMLLAAGVFVVIRRRKKAKIQCEIFPNPFSNSFTVKANAPVLEINIFDMNGNIILKEQANQQEIRIDHCSNWKSGVYIVQVKTADGVVSKKVIKN